MTDKPDDTRTIINVKGISISAWEDAKKAANKRGETMGEWLSRACTHLANLEREDRIIPPAQTANPPAPPVVQAPIIPVDLREVAALMAAMASANVPVQKRVGAKVNALLYTQLKAAAPDLPGRAGRLALEHEAGD